ncbi:hypothetical protein WSM22_32690 [Cytophagales bacterium WSM2-2]|nr:hypothetical protein WSM22_32690 [Cytophagales bacterium WSM2-2]
MVKRCLVIVQLILLTTVLTATAANPKFKNGILSIDSLNENEITSIKGEWEFYWHQLLTPDSFKTKSFFPQYFTVPSLWRRYVINNETLPVRGFATYRLTILNPKKISGLVVKFMGISTACKIWVNDSLVVIQGKVGTMQDSVWAQRLNSQINIPSEEISTITIQVSNFNYLQCGINLPIEIAPVEVIQKRDRIFENIEMIEMGLLIMMVLFNLVLQIKVKRGYSSLFLGIMCFSILFRATENYDSTLVLFRMFPSLDYLIARRVEFVFLFMDVILLPLFVQDMFRNDTSPRGILAFKIIGGVLIVAGIFTPGYLMGIVMNAYYFGILGAFGFSVYVSFLAIRRKRLGATFIFIGVFICLVFVTFEILRVTGYILLERQLFPNMVTLGVIFFLFFQSVAVSAVFSSVLHKVESLSQNLEALVQKRTEQLSRTNIIKDKMFSIISHDLRSPLNSLKGIVDLATSGYASSEEIKTLLVPLKQNLQTSTQLLDDILSWSSIQLKGITYAPEEIHLSSIVDENIKLYQGAASSKGINLVNKVNPNVFVYADINMLRLILRNLISNANKFTSVRGTVKIATEVIGSLVWVSVTDTGIGMSSSKQEQLFEINANRSTLGTNNEKGTGIGLLLCKEFIEQNGGTLSVSSEEGKGSTFNFSLPKAKGSFIIQSSQSYPPDIASASR